MPAKEQDFKGVSLKRELVEEIERFVKTYSQYRGVADFVSEAVRVRMEQIRANIAQQPRFVRLNTDATGTKIWDNQRRALAEIRVNRNGIICSLDNTDKCEHAMFALSDPDVRSLIRKHKAQGWNLPDI